MNLKDLTKPAYKNARESFIHNMGYYSAKVKNGSIDGEVKYNWYLETLN